MPICKECGVSAPRLQWTHFKYKCTGKFENGKEYQDAYPGSEVVDEDLKKKSKVTLETLTNKYGEEEGSLRWDSYREKQSKTNSFEYKQEKYGWTREQFDEYNLSRSATLENMIKRHGEELGLIKWNEYCDRQKYTKSKDYLVDKYGKVEGTKKYLEINKKKSDPHNPKSLAEKLGISIDDAVEIICSRGNYKYTSLLEQEFIKMVENEVGPLDHSSLKNPFGKWCHKLDRYVVYDIKHQDCIVEFNGDYWHANPKFYSESDKIRGSVVKDIWIGEEHKINLAKQLGYRVLVVWENEFLDNKIEVIKKVKKWILKE